jgi:metallopeptidase MepB
MMDEFNIEASIREDIFQLVDAAWKAEKEKGALDGESERLLEKERESYVRNGLGIKKGPKRDRFKEIKKRLGNIEVLTISD